MTTVLTPPQTRHRSGTARAALAYRDFRIVFVGMGLTGIGKWMQNFTLPAYVDARTHSAALVGLLVFTQLGPMLLLSLPAGILADKFPRRPYLLTMQAMQLTLTLGLAALVATRAPLWTVFAVTLGIGAANALNQPVMQASVPLLVHRVDLPGAVSLNSAMMNGTRVLGPALAAVIAALGLSVAAVFVVTAFTYLFLIGALVVVALPDVRGNHPERGWRRLLTGVNIARRRRVLGRGLIAMFLFSLVCLPYIGLFPSVARMLWGLSADGPQYKALYVVWGLGAFAGAIAVGTFLARFDKLRLVSWGFGAFAVCLGVFSLLPDHRPAYGVAIALGFAYFTVTTCLMTILQQNMADTERGAVMPLWMMVFGGTIPIGNLVFGPLMELVGARTVLLFGAAFAGFLAWWADLHRLPAEAFLPEELGGEPIERTRTARLDEDDIAFTEQP